MMRALITGASSPLGSALALHLARKGFDLGLHYHRGVERATALRDDCQALGVSARTLCADLSCESQARAMVSEFLKPDEPLHVLVNNAGVYHAEDLYDITEEHWLAGLHSTASAVFYTTRAALPHLRRAGWARVVNIGDASASRPGARDLAMGYHVGKTGVFMLTRSFAAREAAHGVTVNLISPGYLDNSVDLPHSSTIPAGRFGSVDDVTAAMDYLIAPESQYCTGSELILSGGWNLR